MSGEVDWALTLDVVLEVDRLVPECPAIAATLPVDYGRDKSGIDSETVRDLLDCDGYFLHLVVGSAPTTFPAWHFRSHLSRLLFHAAL